MPEVGPTRDKFLVVEKTIRPMDRRRLVAAAVVIAAGALAGCPTSSETEVVCDGCVSAVERTASETNRSITVEESVTHVHLRKSGDARVEARITLTGADIGDLRTNATFLGTVGDQIASRTVDGGARYDPETRPAFRRTDLSLGINGSVLAVSYRATNVSRRRLGTTLVTHFYRADGDTLPDEQEPRDPWVIATDRLVVHAPDGTEPLLHPPGTTVEGRALAWDGNGTVSTRTYLVFGPDSSRERLLGRIVVGSEVARWGGYPAASDATLPTVFLCGLAILLSSKYSGRVDDGWDPEYDTLYAAFDGMTGLLVTATVVTAFVAIVAGPAIAIVAGGFSFFAWMSMQSAGESDQHPRTRPATETSDRGTHTDRDVDSDSSTRWATDLFASVTERVPSPDWRSFLANTAPLSVVLVLTAFVAADYRAAFAGWVAVVAGLVPLVTLPALGYFVTRPDRAAVRTGLIVSTAASPWLVAFPLVVQRGSTPILPFLWGASAGLLGTLLFYAVLRFVTE
jgi:hypothetical protein